MRFFLIFEMLQNLSESLILEIEKEVALYTISMQLMTVWATEFSYFKSDSMHMCWTMTHYLTDGYPELDNYPSTSAHRTKAAQKWLERF